MSLDFPNSIRRYEPGRGCASFWGSEASLEVMFQIELDVLRTLSPAVIDGARVRSLSHSTSIAQPYCRPLAPPI